MTRNTDHPRADRDTPDAASGCDFSLPHIPDDWNADSAASTSAKAAKNDLVTNDVEIGRVELDNGELREGSPNLLKAMLALDLAKNNDDIAAARAILRFSAF